MNTKVLSMIIISACLYGQVWSSNALSAEDRESDTTVKISRIGITNLIADSSIRIDEFGKALVHDDYFLALRILREFSPLQKDISECRDVEKQLNAKKTTICLLFANGVDRQKFETSLQQLEIITEFVQAQKESAKEAEKAAKEAASKSQACAIQ